MNIPEREQLEQFLSQLTQARATAKDAEAEGLIREACSRQPDAAYLLVQRAMQLEQLLAHSQHEAAQLRSELAQARPAGSGFLNDSNAWGRPATSGPAAAAPVTAAPSSAAPAPMPWGSGLLGNIASTAAGVVAGSFLFQGIESLLHAGSHHAALASTPDRLVDAPVYDGLFSRRPGDGDFDAGASDDGGFSDGGSVDI